MMTDDLIQLNALRSLFLVENHISDLHSMCSILSQLPHLQRIDLKTWLGKKSNPGNHVRLITTSIVLVCDDAGYEVSLFDAAPQLTVLDGERLLKKGISLKSLSSTLSLNYIAIADTVIKSSEVLESILLPKSSPLTFASSELGDSFTMKSIEFFGTCSMIMAEH